MTRRNYLILIFTFLCVAMVAVFSFSVSAAETPSDEYIVRYHQADGGDPVALTEIVQAGNYTLKNSSFAPDSRTFFGWYTAKGDLYSPGQQITVSEDLDLYEAKGIEANNINTILSNEALGRTLFVKLTGDITTTQTIDTSNGGVLVLYLNGHNISINNSSDAFRQERSGLVIIGKGIIQHQCTGISDTALEENKPAFFTTQRHTAGGGYYNEALRFWIGKDVDIRTNCTLFKLNNDMSGSYGYPPFKIYGKINAVRLLQSQGSYEMSIDIYETARITLSATSGLIFNDISTRSAAPQTLANVTIHGGTFTIGNNVSFFNDETRYNFTIVGGTFNRDMSTTLSTNYKCTNNGNGTYSVELNLCPATGKFHRYRATDLTVTCTEAGIIQYECDYCGEAYTLTREALGHSYIMTSSQNMINTQEETVPGYYECVCPRCGDSYNEYFYPDPSTTYVTVKVRRDGTEETLRVKSTLLFSFTGDDRSIAKTYFNTGFDYVYPDGTKKTFKPYEIVSVEIPLGTRTVYGLDNQNGRSGLFFANKYLEEVIIPQSVEILQPYCMAEMSNLKTIKGIENVSQIIDKYAFYRSSTLNPVVLDTVEINANEVREGAFNNVFMSSLYLHDTVQIIQSNAFKNDGKITNPLKEVIVESGENIKKDGSLTFSQYLNTYKVISYSSTGNDTINNCRVYADHDFTAKKVLYTCEDDGYDLHTCSRCGYFYKDNFVPKGNTSHIYSKSPADNLKSTCTTNGQEAWKCGLCGKIEFRDALPLDPNNHNLDTTTPNSDSCTKTSWLEYATCSGCGYVSVSDFTVVNQSAPLGHNYVEADRIPNTCSKDGYTVKKCSHYGCKLEERKVLYADPLLHTLITDTVNSKASTCKENGFKLLYCSNEGCDYTVQSELPSDSNAHVMNPTPKQVVAPTETRAGRNDYYCSLCNKVIKTESVPRLNVNGENAGGLPAVAIVFIVIGSVLLVGGLGVGLYFIFFKKKNKALGFKYKFNTLGKH